MRKISDIEYCLSRLILNANHSHLHGIDKRVMAFSLIRRMKDPLSRYFLQHPKISTIYVLLNQSVCRVGRFTLASLTNDITYQVTWRNQSL